MRLDRENIAKLSLPPGQSEMRVFDDALKGFGVRLRAGGKRTWIIQYRAGGRQTCATLGPVNVLSPAQARARAEKDLATVLLGGDPQSKKRDERTRASETLGVIAAHYLARQRTRLKARSLEQIEVHLTKHWAPLAGVPLHKITRREIAEQLVRISDDRGPFAANRARTSLSGFFTWAMREGLVDVNPVLATNLQADEKPRDRVLAAAELVSIWKACGEDDYGRIVRLLILTGQRRDEVGLMARSEIDLAARNWSLPRARTKNNQPHEVPLADLAFDILSRAMARPGREERERIFGEGDADRGFSGWSKAKLALDKRAGAAPWRLHDLRRTVATGMADIGILPHVVEAVLNHASGHKAGVAGIYNRASYANEKRQALDLWAAHVEALIAGKAASNIVSLRA